MDDDDVDDDDGDEDLDGKNGGLEREFTLPFSLDELPFMFVMHSSSLQINISSQCSSFNIES